MLRTLFGKLVWLGRATSAVVGLAVVLALVVGVSSVAMGATGGNFILGKANSATTVSKLTASIAGPALTLVNQSTEAAATALNISVAEGKVPIKVNASAGTATNLSADELDGTDSDDLLPGGVLPAGATVRGAYEIDGHVPAGGNLVGGDSISFVYTLPSAPAVRFVPQGAPTFAECPGTADSPQAAPGWLCVYEQARVNLSQEPTVNTVGRSGGHIYANAATAGGAYGYGKWAVTAPTPSEAQTLARKDGDAMQQRREP